MKGIGFGLGSFLKITIIAIVGIVFAKWIFKKVKVPGLSAAVEAA
jgi:hypothetical protein